jgi:hypothetical protein
MLDIPNFQVLPQPLAEQILGTANCLQPIHIEYQVNLTALLINNRSIVVIVGYQAKDYYLYKINLKSICSSPNALSWQSSSESPERGFGHNMETHPPGTAVSCTLAE